MTLQEARSRPLWHVTFTLCGLKGQRLEAIHANTEQEARAELVARVAEKYYQHLKEILSAAQVKPAALS